MTAVAPPVRARPGRRMFYVGMAVACAAAAFVGFAPTFFLKGLFDSPPLPLLVHLHGAVFTCWILLLIAQTGLVRAGRTDLHRRFGVAGLGLAALMIVLGIVTAIGGARRGITVEGMDPLAFLAVPLAAIALFAAFITLAALNRARPEHHKRLMLLATFSVLTPALARLWFAHQHPEVAFVLTMVFVLIAVGYDLLARRRVHPVYLWGGFLVLASFPLRFGIAQTDLWHSIARAIVRQSSS